jgi:hypothetical protein
VRTAQSTTSVRAAAASRWCATTAAGAVKTSFHMYFLRNIAFEITNSSMVCLRIANAFSWTVLLKKMFESDERGRVQPAETQSSGTGPRSLGGRYCVRLRAGGQLRQEGPIRAPLARKTCRCAAPRRLWRRADCRGPNLPLLVTSLVGVARRPVNGEKRASLVLLLLCWCRR